MAINIKTDKTCVRGMKPQAVVRQEYRRGFKNPRNQSRTLTANSDKSGERKPPRKERQ